MTTTIPILAQCAVCDALLAAHELTAHPAHGLICADRGGCVARKRDRLATAAGEEVPTAPQPPPAAPPAPEAPEPTDAPPPGFLAAWEASNARRIREREQRRAVRRGRAA